MFHLLLTIIYLSFISLGLPDGLLGAAWPTIYPELSVPVSYAGILFAIISGGSVWLCLQRFVLDALPVGDSLWSGRRQRRCQPE